MPIFDIDLTDLYLGTSCETGQVTKKTINLTEYAQGGKIIAIQYESTNGSMWGNTDTEKYWVKTTNPKATVSCTRRSHQQNNIIHSWEDYVSVVGIRVEYD